MAIEKLQSFLGTGWSFPPAFDKIGKQVRWRKIRVKSL